MLLRLAFILALALAPSAALGAAKIGKLAPKFVLTTYDGQQVPLESLRGKVVILNFWATWCAPCRRELPQIDTYVRRHRSRPLAVYAVTIDNTVPYARLRFLADTLAFPLIEKVKGGGYGAIKGAVPSNYVIDKAGVVRYAQAGAFDLESLEETVTPMLSEPDPEPSQAVAARE